VSLIARHLEANGITTVIIGSAMDIVEHCGVPRFVFTDFPLGNPCGHPWRTDMQRDIVKSALESLVSAQEPRTTIVSQHKWKDDPGWRERYGRVVPEELERLAAIGEEQRQQRASAIRKFE